MSPRLIPIAQPDTPTIDIQLDGLRVRKQRRGLVEFDAVNIERRGPAQIDATAVAAAVAYGMAAVGGPEVELPG